MKTNAIVEGAVSAAIIVLLSLLNLIFGFFSFLVPVPLAIIIYRHNLKTGMIVAFAAAMVSSLFLMSPLIGIDLLIVGILGIALGAALKENFKFIYLLLIGVGASVIGSIIRISSLAVISGFDPIESYTEITEGLTQQILELFERGSIPEELLMQYTEILSILPSMMQMMMPLLLVIIGFAETIIALIVLRIIFSRFKVMIPGIPPFITWKFPWYFVWGFIIAKAFGILLSYFPYELLQMVVVNMDVLFSVIFSIQGLSLGWYYLTRAGMSKILRIIVTILVLLTGNYLIYYLLMIAGVLDTWFDFRKLTKLEKEEK